MNALDVEDVILLSQAIDLLHQPAAAEAAQLRTALNSAHLRLRKIESFVVVSTFALRAQACDVDCDVAAVLDAAISNVAEVRDSLENTLDLLPQRSAPDLHSRLAAVRAKLRTMRGGAA